MFITTIVLTVILNYVCTLVYGMIVNEAARLRPDHDPIQFMQAKLLSYIPGMGLIIMSCITVLDFFADVKLYKDLKKIRAELTKEINDVSDDR